MAFAVVFGSSNSNEKELSIKFYNKKIVFEIPAPFLVSNTEIESNAETTKKRNDYAYIIAKSKLLNLFLAENEFNFYIYDHSMKENLKLCLIKSIRMQKNFAKTLKNIIIYWIDKEDKAEVYNTLNHIQFRQLINSYDLNTLGTDFLIHLICCYPQIFKKHLHLLKDLKCFSFLMPEIALILFEDRNHLVSPFSFKNLVRTVDLEVLIALLDLWDYELKREDIECIFQNWINDPIFVAKIEEDPRSWLLWKKLDIIKPVPIDILLKCIEIDRTILKYTNLLLAIIYHTEFIIFELLCSLEYFYADLHKNDAFEFLNFSPENVSMLNINKCILWYEKLKGCSCEISEMMNLKGLLIDKLTGIISDDNTNDTVEISLINNLLVLLKIPLFCFNRVAFLNSLDGEIVKKVFETLVLKSIHFCPVVMNWQVGILEFWIFLWSQLNNFGIINTYDKEIASNLNETTSLIDLLTDINYSTNKNQVRRTYWHIPLAVMVLKKTTDIEESDICINALISFMKNQSCELLPNFFMQICTYLAPESLGRIIPNIGYFDSYLETFKLAPEMLTRDQIRNFLKNQKSSEFALLYAENVMRLKTLVDFRGFHLLKFFPIGSDYHLEFHEALHTARPEALIDYLIGIKGGLNYPEQFLLSVHPIAWKYPKFVNLIIYNIPFSFFLKYPQKIESLNLYNLILNIKESLECIETCLQVKKKIIIKLLIQMEWIFNQFHVVKFSNSTQIENIETIFNNFVKLEKILRSEIIAWLKDKSNMFPSDKDWFSICNIVETLPLSFVRLSTCYNYHVSSNFCYNTFDL